MPQGRIPEGDQSNRLETDRSSLMRKIASATSGAIDSCRMLCDRRIASVAPWMFSTMPRLMPAYAARSEMVRWSLLRSSRMMLPLPEAKAYDDVPGGVLYAGSIVKG